MARPTVVPRWASDLSADVATPSVGKQLLGFVDAEEAAAEYVNWLFLHGYNWQQYFDAGGHAQKGKVFGLVDGVAGTAGWAVDPSGTPEDIVSSTATAEWAKTPEFSVGDTIEHVTLRVTDGAGTSTVSVFLYVMKDGAVVQLVASGVSSAGGTAEDVTTSGGATEHKLAAGEYVLLRINASGAGSAARTAHSATVFYRNDND